jgi:methionine synthase I (cobalamin-dependent)
MGNVKAIKQHIAAGSDLNVKDDYGSTPLNIAVTFEKTEIAKLLIDAGADLSIQSADGSTALHTASFLGRTELVEALLKAGADTEAQNSFGSTPLASIEVPFEQAKPIYDQLSKDLGPLGFKLDYDELENARPVIAEMIKTYQ